MYFQGQLGLLSDKNFLEQYYKNEFDMGPNQETFAYLTWQRRNFGASALAEDRVTRQWVTETNWLPQVKGNLIGQTFLDDLFVYSARGQAGYAQLKPTEDPPYALLSTDQKPDNTGRFDLWQELSVPFALGPVKIAPYGVLDLTEYTSDVNGNEIGRIYGAGGARASLPFSRLYDDVASELLNVRGLYHKIVFGANYRYARTNVPYTQLPLLDRLNDDATDQAWRNITPMQPTYVPGPNGLLLANAPGISPFNPQQYAIRRVVEDSTDTLDNINVLQADVRQRFQTKRGYPGMEHTVDVLTFDVSASYFPDASRDNFGHPFSFLEYAATWNVGDRTALVSNGWFEPYDGGSRYWNAGVYLNRTDRTNIYLGYRQTDPLNSKAVSLNLGYQLSHRYYLTVGSAYDFGLQAALSNTLLLTRTGTDLTVSMGFTYTAFVNSFGFQFMVVPNLASDGWLGPVQQRDQRPVPHRRADKGVLERGQERWQCPGLPLIPPPCGQLGKRDHHLMAFHYFLEKDNARGPLGCDRRAARAEETPPVARQVQGSDSWCQEGRPRAFQLLGPLLVRCRRPRRRGGVGMRSMGMVHHPGLYWDGADGGAIQQLD